MLRGADDNGLLDEPYENEQQVQRWVQGRVMTDEDRPPKSLPEWGFLLATRLMHGKSTIVCPDGNVGAYERGGNNFVIDGPDWFTSYTADCAASHIANLAESWMSDWAVWQTHAEFKTQQTDLDNIQFGPVTHVAGIDARRLSAQLPDTAHAAQLHDGALITIGNGRQDYRYDDIYLVRDALREIRGTLAYR